MIYSKTIAIHKELCKISERYEGLGIATEEHNFPASFIEKTDNIYDFVKKNKIEYIIGVYNLKSIQHERLYAKYYLDKEYKEKIDEEWNDMEYNKRNKIIAFLKKLGYDDKVLIDEYQAYR